MNHQNRCAIGVDLGGTKIEAGLVNEAGTILKHVRLETNVKGGPSVIKDQIVSAIRELEKESPCPLSGIGVGVAGQIELKTGVVLFAPNLNWHRFPLQEELAQSLQKPVVIVNDVRAATWGEWLYGAGKGYRDLVCMFIGTGIGGGVVSGGHLLEGCSNTLGEIGHIPIDLRGPICTCGNRGCFESLAGGWGIAKRAQEAVLKYGVAGIYLLKLAGGKIDQVAAKHLIQAAQAKDPLSELLMEQVKQALIAGSVAVVNAFNPCLLILGGGIIEGAPELITQIELGIRQKALAAATSSLQVVQAKLHGEAGMVGSAAVAMNLFK